MKKLALAIGMAAVAGLAPFGAPAEETPLSQNPLGPIVDVTSSWQAYQPAAEFCVKPDVFEFSGNSGATATGADAACAFSGFAVTETALYKVRITTPILCAGCRRLLIKYSLIPQDNSPPFFYAHGKAYFRLQSPNWGYTVDPKAHSPNVKNVTNDKVVAPDGSFQEQVTHAFDLHAMSYVGDTAHFAHSAVQGPWYIGPWYLSRDGRRIVGAYLDVDVMGAVQLPDPRLNEIGYQAGFNSGEATCPDNVLFGGGFADGNYFYAGCATHPGGSSEGVDPFA